MVSANKASSVYPVMTWQLKARGKILLLSFEISRRIKSQIRVITWPDRHFKKKFSNLLSLISEERNENIF